MRTPVPIRPPKHKPGVQRRASADAPQPARPRRHDPRASARERGYDTAWEKASKGYLIRHPLCVHCLAEGIVTTSTVTDHIIPHRGDMVLFWASDTNWQALCKRHHDKKTATEDGGFGNKRRER